MEGDETTRAGRWASVAPYLLMVVALLAWLWPIGLGGEMPIGGDVTQFSIGLMAELGRALRAGRIPFWNDLWGYGFPGLAESQMGVFYPPHILLYGLLPVELAYTACLVLHTLWSGLGAAWASRRFGSSHRGAALAGFAWASGGFFLVHLPHQWGASTASWMPWAWGLAWLVARGEGGRRAALLLAAVLAIQVLPGHFQLAFITQATASLVGLCGLVSRWDRGRRTVPLLLAFAAVIPLGLAQLAPTAELASLSKSQRSVEYLSAFASPPSHLVSYVAPGLFHQSPLWRPLAWDAFHAMPEEHLAAIGLVPLFLAMLALKGWRDPVVRTLALVALVATCLSLGPYFPGFSTYARLPGFSFFRAPARWGAAAMLALAILAGRGLDALTSLPRPARSLRRFVLIAASLPLLVVALFELALFATGPVEGRPDYPEITRLLDRSFRLMPWSADPPLSAYIRDTRRTLHDNRVQVALARQGQAPEAANRSLAATRGAVYLQEIGPTVAALAALVVLSTLAGRRRVFAIGLIVLMLAEAGYWSRKRPFDLGPIRPLTEQSAVLRELASLPRGTRSVDPAKNLVMIAGSAPLAAYRTLDLPCMAEFTQLATAPALVNYPQAEAAMRAIGVGVRIFDTWSYSLILKGSPALIGWRRVAEVDDPSLVGWLTGADFVTAMAKGRGPYALSLFTIWRPVSEPARAWFVSGRLSAGGDPQSVLAALGPAKPLAWRSDRPEDVTVEFDATGPGTVVLAQLDYPRWRATLNGQPVPIARAFDGWQGVEVPGSGRWTLLLHYDASRDWACIGVSGLAWMAWGLLYWKAKPKLGRQVEENGR